MLKLIKQLLLKIIDDIDAGNTNIEEPDALDIINKLRSISDKSRLSKYSACKYLNISRATFDNYIREGLIPKGEHTIGFKELCWYKTDLDKFIKNKKQNGN